MRTAAALRDDTFLFAADFSGLDVVARQLVIAPPGKTCQLPGFC